MKGFFAKNLDQKMGMHYTQQNTVCFPIFYALEKQPSNFIRRMRKIIASRH